jgi:subtilase family serine protease
MRYAVGTPLLAGFAAVLAGALLAPVSSHGAAARPEQAVVAVSPMVVSRFEQTGQPLTTAQCEAQYHLACYQAPQLQVAYNLGPLYRRGITGAGQTIVLVDSYGSPTIRHDLAVYDAQYGLPAPPSFKIIQPAGPVPPFKKNSDFEGWAGETTLDVEAAHTIAPGANILLVETPVSETEGVTGFPQIVRAENYVINHNLGDVISQSFGATEETFPNAASVTALRSAYANAAAHRVTVSPTSASTRSPSTPTGWWTGHRVIPWSRRSEGPSCTSTPPVTTPHRTRYGTTPTTTPRTS